MNSKKRNLLAKVLLGIGIFIVIGIVMVSFVLDTGDMDVHEIAKYSLYTGYAKGIGAVCLVLSIILGCKKNN